MKEELRNKMVKKARENGEKHGKVAELDFGAGAEWMYEQLVKNNAVLPHVMPGGSRKDCDCSQLKHKIDRDQFPYGEDIEYDQCVKCGARYNLHIL